MVNFNSNNDNNLFHTPSNSFASVNPRGSGCSVLFQMDQGEPLPKYDEISVAPPPSYSHSPYNTNLLPSTYSQNSNTEESFFKRHTCKCKIISFTPNSVVVWILRFLVCCGLFMLVANLYYLFSEATANNYLM